MKKLSELEFGWVKQHKLGGIYVDVDRIREELCAWAIGIIKELEDDLVKIGLLNEKNVFKHITELMDKYNSLCPLMNTQPQNVIATKIWAIRTKLMEMFEITEEDLK